MPTAAQIQAALPTGMRAGACIMLHAGGLPGGPARQRAVEAIAHSGAQGYDSAALDADLAKTPHDATAELGRVGAQLAVPAREWFLAEVVRIGMADGPLTDGEREAAHVIGAGLGMTQAQTLGVVTMTERSASSW